MKAILTLLKDLKVDFAEVMIEKHYNDVCSYRNKTLENLSESFETGINVRVLNNGNWAFISFNDMNEIKDAIEVAKRITELYKHGKSKISRYPQCEFISLADKVVNVGIAEKKDIMDEFYNMLLRDNNLSNATLSYSFTRTEKNIMNSEGTYIQKHNKESGIYIDSTDKAGNTSYRAYRSANDFNGFHNMRNLLENYMKESEVHTTFTTIEPGRYPVVLDSHASGVIFHEAFGHLSEADFLISNPKLKNKLELGEKIAPDYLNIIDDPTIKGFRGSFEYDDEGVKGECKYLLKNGIVNTFLHSRETSEQMSTAPNGSARSVSYKYPPMVRMSNFMVCSGTETKASILEGIDKGVLIEGAKSGQTKFDQFTFQPYKAYLIENGKIDGQLKNIHFSGNIFECLENVRLANDFAWNDNGVCSKGVQNGLPITLGSPSARLESILVGGS